MDVRRSRRLYTEVIVLIGLRSVSLPVIAVFAAGIVSTASAATLKVSSFPSGAQVSIDGVSTGKVTPLNIAVTEGDHTVTVQIPGAGWQPDTRTITIGPGSNDLSVTLLPTLTAGATGAKGEKGDKGDPGARADPPCFDNGSRYVDCGNGTVTDTVTGLIWLQDSECLGVLDWASANQAAAALKEGACNLTDGSTPGDWRLATVAEWQTTMSVAQGLGCESPSLTETSGTGCAATGSLPFVGTIVATFWTSTPVAGAPVFANFASLSGIGGTHNLRRSGFGGLRVWPVRSPGR
jgi:hypothetical protein